VYDNYTKIAKSHRCGGAAGGFDDPWRTQQGKDSGRYFCFTDPYMGNVPVLFAGDEDHFVVMEFTADPPESPYQVPKDEQALVDWLTNKFKFAS
jgi:hypothetical protein